MQFQTILQNCGRALILLQSKGIIKLSDQAGLEATEKDIVKNAKNFTFKPVEAAQLPRILEEVDGAVINGNYATLVGNVHTVREIFGRSSFFRRLTNSHTRR